MDKIAIIRQEIERRRLHFNKEAEKYQALNNGYSQNCYGARDALRDLENFLDTLEAEERPEPYIPVYDEEYLTEKQRLFKEHHGEVDVDKMLAECRGYDEEKEEPDKSLEEAAENIYKVPFGTRAEDFITGAEWQKERDEMSKVNYEGARAVYDNTVQHLQEKIDEKYELGKKDMKQQMLKDAVEGEVYLYHSYNRDATAILVDIPKENLGDKVRIVVLKEEEE